MFSLASHVPFCSNDAVLKGKPSLDYMLIDSDVITTLQYFHFFLSVKSTELCKRSPAVLKMTREWDHRRLAVLKINSTRYCRLSLTDLR